MLIILLLYINIFFVTSYGISWHRPLRRNHFICIHYGSKEICQF
ncbi:MAG TPA: hypothetical protein PL045_02170 [Chitinophagaceae bacterium]|nr:hypothetical protein [Chitinophagaceae bacterium]